ncbi:hypothetical protein [Hufsiella ginkgonis]|uniref:Uncharacterized protein n=1 Tax=Hufsiella ginkgonis TaxID=2695274 RepID=A0A7K1XWB3_9SPHI|nr:hypothetical protein [Hufsiella ginkgonis]MXV15282.1 hypothetical protein [Hufsiella ginkgonis]
MLLSNFTVAIVYTEFKLNETYIAKVLCINKEKPQLHCNGKCYLAKKLKQAEEKDKNEERNGQKFRFQEAFLTASDKLSVPFYFVSVTVSQPASCCPREHRDAIFHPPQAS